MLKQTETYNFEENHMNIKHEILEATKVLDINLYKRKHG
jgi:hypothetical protein